MIKRMTLRTITLFLVFTMVGILFGISIKIGHKDCNCALCNRPSKIEYLIGN